MAPASFVAADPGLIFWLLAPLHIVGLVSVLLTRLPRSHRVRGLCHHGFLACLFFVAGATLFTILTQNDWWVWSGTTFSLMAVGATAEWGRAVQAPGF
jgi:hypothetical protein